MDSLLQGTNPGLKFEIDEHDFAVTDMASLRLVIFNDGNGSIKELSDVTLDQQSNSFTYDFTEEETFALNPKKPLLFQFRALLTGGAVVGTRKSQLDVADLMYDREVMSG